MDPRVIPDSKKVQLYNKRALRGIYTEHVSLNKLLKHIFELYT